MLESIWPEVRLFEVFLKPNEGQLSTSHSADVTLETKNNRNHAQLDEVWQMRPYFEALLAEMQSRLHDNASLLLSFHHIFCYGVNWGSEDHLQRLFYDARKRTIKLRSAYSKEEEKHGKSLRQWARWSCPISFVISFLWMPSEIRVKDF